MFCRDCFASRPASPAPVERGSPRRPSGRGTSAPPTRGTGTPRQRMMAQGRKAHFIHDARAVLLGTAGGMDESHVRAFLEGLFARGARTSTEAAQVYLDEKLAEEVITPAQRRAVGDLVERYSFWR